MQSILLSSKQTTYHNISLVIIGSILLAIASQVAIPLTPVPLTLQTSIVLFIGMIYGSRLGATVIMLYLLEGLCGLPVFAGMSFGLHTLLSPSGGYLIGFLPAVVLSGYLMEIGFSKYRLTTFLAGLLGTLIIFIFGVCVLSRFIGFHQAYIYGVYPFVVTETIKLIAFSLIAHKFWKPYTLRS